MGTLIRFWTISLLGTFLSNISFASCSNNEEDNRIKVIGATKLTGNSNGSSQATKYHPDWKSLDSRPIPQWYDNAKFGVKINWGVFSVPGIDGPWFWHCWKESQRTNPECLAYIEKNFKPGFTYQELAPLLSGTFFNASELASLIQSSGAQYAVITGKHHDGFAMFKTKYAFSWNAIELGPHRDVVAEFASALSEKSIPFGVYFSLLSWYHPLFLLDKNNNFTTSQFPSENMLPQLKELVSQYEPSLIWTDGQWDASDSYWSSKEFLTWLYNQSPVRDKIVVNDRWGNTTICRHGGFLTCKDRYNPKKLQSRKWENIMSLHRDSWSFRANAKAEDFLTIEELITIFAETVSCGGNLLLNVGPDRTGTLQPIVQERLLQIGKWLGVNGNAIFSSKKPWMVQEDAWSKGVWYTWNGEQRVWGILTQWPKQGFLDLMGVTLNPALKTISEVRMLGVEGTLIFKLLKESRVRVNLPKTLYSSNLNWAWVLEFVFN